MGSTLLPAAGAMKKVAAAERAESCARRTRFVVMLARACARVCAFSACESQSQHLR